MIRHHHLFSFFFFNDTATTEIYTLSLHDALPILAAFIPSRAPFFARFCLSVGLHCGPTFAARNRSEEHTSELQSRLHLVCRLLLEKKKQKITAGTLMHNSHVCQVSKPPMRSASET